MFSCKSRSASSQAGRCSFRALFNLPKTHFHDTTEEVIYYKRSFITIDMMVTSMYSINLRNTTQGDNPGMAGLHSVFMELKICNNSLVHHHGFRRKSSSIPRGQQRPPSHGGAQNRACNRGNADALRRVKFRSTAPVNCSRA